MDLPELKFRQRPGTYARGQESIELILRTTLQILIEEGYRAISLRKIAAACDMKVGNVTYYFPTKDRLVQEMLDAAMDAYVGVFDEITGRTDISAEKKLEEVIRFVLLDIQTKKTTRLFPELWALANFDPFVAELVNGVYEIERSVFRPIIAELNPSLNAEECEAVSLFITASLEGTTIFCGFEKPWAHRRPWVESMAIKSLVSFARDATPENIRGLSA